MSADHFDDTVPFSRAAFHAAGRHRSELRTDVYVQILPRVWIRKAAIDRDSLVRAALSLHPEDAFASHLSAAAVLGLPVPDHAFAHVTVHRVEDRRYRSQIKTHAITRPRRVIKVRGMRVTDPIATFIDCAGWLSLIDLVVLGDALVKKFGITPAQLLRACRASGDYYAGLARIGAELVRAGVDSPMETRLRLLIVLAGLPEPTVNFCLRREDGTVRRRFDLCYPGIKLIVEYDGRHHAESVVQWEKDIDRREEMDDDGYRIVVVTARGVFREPARTLQRIRRQLVLRGFGDVPEIDEAWQEYFSA